jgi:DNA-binding NtrC family response regulator
MHAGVDLLDLSILYDTARGFLGLRERDERLRYALLCLMGATGASTAMYLERDDRRLSIRETRGFVERPQGSLKLTRKLESALRGPDPVRRDRITPLGASLARFAERHAVEILVGQSTSERAVGVFALGAKLFGEDYDDREISLVADIAKLASLALTPAPSSLSQLEAVPGSKRLEALRAQYPFLREFRGEGLPTAALFEELVAVADFDLPVLILGETGTGKELVARFIHELSQRKGSFEAINCAAIPSELMASALFCHEQGAFTGAVSRVRGAFERAGNGTIFLDEIGDMPPDTQASLLRVLQERSFQRVGGESSISAQARVISATNRNLLGEVEKGTFRSDLFYRLQMYSVRIPPLRERKEEIPTLAAHILEQHCQSKRPTPSISPEFLQGISDRSLKGNMRELESLIVAAIVRAGSADELLLEHLSPESTFDPEPTPGEGTLVRALPPLPERPPSESEAGAPPVSEPTVPSYETMERQYIRSVLQLTEGNKKEAAELMGIPRTTLNARIKKLGIENPRPVLSRAGPGKARHASPTLSPDESPAAQ